MALRPAERPYITDSPWLGRGAAKIMLGLMTPRRKLASSAYFPGPRARAPLYGGKQPYWQVFNYSLNSRQSGDSRIVTGKNFTLVALMGNSNQAGLSFRTQFYHMVGPGLGFRFSRVGENFSNHVGSATDPFILRRPYVMAAETSLQNRTQNLTTNTNAIQIVAYGLMD